MKPTRHPMPPACTSTLSLALQCIVLLATPALYTSAMAAEECWPGFVPSPWFDEQVCEVRFEEEQARAIVNAPLPSHIDAELPTVLVIYATPNGNTVEQTLGCRLTEGLDWHFDIQHAAAQVRLWRKVNTRENIVLACIQADIRSWPTWRARHEDNHEIITRFVRSLVDLIPVESVQIVLTGHSGGGSFMFGYLDAAEEFPDSVRRIAFLDANYGYSDDRNHSERALRWLEGDADRRFIVLAYDDRNIMLNGKKVVGPTGGTYRASHRMIDRLKQLTTVKEDTLGEFNRFIADDGQLITLIHPNPDNIILHTRLVGEMNGLLYVLTVDTPEEAAWGGTLAKPRAYTDYVQPEPYDPAGWKTAPPVSE